MPAWSSISVILITREAAGVLGPALDSIPREAEVIVADDTSSDGTAGLARARGATVVAQDPAVLAAAHGNFDVARNAAASHATRDWWFFLDADERMTPELAAEVAAARPAPACAAFDLPRTNRFWGRPVRLLGDDRQVRLVRRGRGRFPEGPLHQKMVVEGEVAHLAAALLHDHIRSWRDVRERFRRYVPVEAAAIPARPSWPAILQAGAGHFVYYARTMGAWRDGARGLLVAAIYAAYRMAVLRAARRLPKHA